ncbi:hypothetical protein L7F22_002800 [Adiantum nelumboides]|nr:hypothetical protein [Adiantum nelumboides]
MERTILCVAFFFIVPNLVSSSHGYFLHSSRTHAHRKPPLSTLAPSESAPFTAGPEVFFEVSRPAGGSSSPCAALILQHAFAYTYDLPPAVANYTPPSHCGTLWDQIVLKWSGTCKGRQYDRIAAVWFGGIEVLRTCTAEPTSTGIYWEVRKDVTRFASVFKDPQLVVIELANVVDSTYTGIFNINLTLEFYTSRHHGSQGPNLRRLDHDDGHHAMNSWSAGLDSGKHSDPFIHADADSRASITDESLYNKNFDTPSRADSRPGEGMDAKLSRKHLESDRVISFHGGEMRSMYEHGVHRKTADDGFHKGSTPIDLIDVVPPSNFPVGSPADLVIPISKSDGFSGGHWFDLATENDTAFASFSPPRNILRAVLEICVSFHGTDEFWYTNPPNDYLEANGLSGYPGNGPFREVQVFLDDVLVGAVFPFPVIFTGGINPLYWRPAAAIGAYNLPSYDVELTPFVGLLVDGNNHTISMRVTNADGSWPLDANLHLWLDPYTSQTMGGVLSHNAPTSIPTTASDFEGLDGTFHTSVARSIAFSGYTAIEKE